MPHSRTPRHVILVTTDHMRYDCIGAYGFPAMHTPNLDALAGAGVNFHQTYTQAHCCMPSRASFFTSLYPPQSGVLDNGYALPGDFEPIAPAGFRAAGYHTGHIGKLHLQPHIGVEHEAQPIHRYGFDSFVLSESITKPDDAYVRYLDAVYPEHRHEFIPTACRRSELVSPKQRVIDAPWQAGHSGFCAHEACTYLDMRGFHQQFLHIGMFAPHPPLTPTAEAFAPYDGVDLPLPRMGAREWEDKPAGKLQKLLQQNHGWSMEDFVEYRRFFYAMVTELDLAVGAVMKKLEARGELDDSLIIFTSDHGDQCGDHGITLKGPHFYDQIMRVPLIMHWPNGLGRERRDVHEMLEMVDMLPTILGLSGGRPHEAMMGRNHAPQLLAQQAIDGRPDVFAMSGDQYIMLRTGSHKYLRYGPGAEVLYDLADHVQYEVVNHASDPAFKDVLLEMRDRALTRMTEACRSRHRRLACW